MVSKCGSATVPFLENIMFFVLKSNKIKVEEPDLQPFPSLRFQIAKGNLPNYKIPGNSFKLTSYKLTVWL